MKRDNQTLKVVALLLVAIAVSTVSAGFLGDVLWWYFNQLTYYVSFGSVFSCWAIGFWGLLLANDNGKMISDCLDLWGGSKVEFPVDHDWIYDLEGAE